MLASALEATLRKARSIMKTIRLLTFAVAAVLVVTISLSGQTYQGRILGLVADSSGAVVTGAKVTITNTATGISRSLTTTAAGDYNAPNLEPGPYVVTVEAPGFKKIQRTDLQLEVAKDIRVDFTLNPGAITETMTVSEEAPMIDTTTDVLGGTFSNKAINELPLLGRDFQNLADLQPGIQRTPGGGFLSTTANGNRPEDNNYIVDGLDAELRRRRSLPRRHTLNHRLQLPIARKAGVGDAKLIDQRRRIPHLHSVVRRD